MLKRAFVYRLVVILFCLFAVSSCMTPKMYTKIKSKVHDAQDEVKQHYAREKEPVPVVLTKDTAFVDATHISLKRPPMWLNKNITIHGTNLPFDFYNRKILEKTGLFVHYDSSVKADKPISINYSGSIKGVLRDLEAQSGYAYRFDNSTLTWSEFVTRTFNIAFLPGENSFTMGRKGGSNSGGSNSGSSGSSSNSNNGGSGGSGSTSTTRAQAVNTGGQYANLEGKLSVWKDLKATVESLVSPQGKVMVSQATTTVTVRDHLSNVEVISEYIENLNSTLSKQVLLDVEVIEINLNESFNFGINWNLVNETIALQGNMAEPVNVTNLGNTTAMILGFGKVNNSSNSGTGVSPTSPTGNPVKFLLNALQQQGNVAVVTQPRVVTLNNQVAELNISKETGYLAGVQNTITGGDNSFSQGSLQAGKVISGFSLYVLPKIEDGEIYLQVSSTLAGEPSFQTVSSSLSSDPGSQPQSITVPTQSLKTFNQAAKVPSGATLIISGFKQLSSTANKDAFFGIDALGGKGGIHDNIETLILITPTVLRNYS